MRVNQSDAMNLQGFYPLSKWVGATQPRIVVFARRDMVPMKAMDEWRRYLTSGNEYPMFWIDSKLGTGIREVRLKQSEKNSSSVLQFDIPFFVMNERFERPSLTQEHT